jgi:hypothetical protein
MEYEVVLVTGEVKRIKCTTMHVTPGLGHLKFLDGRGSNAEVIFFVNAAEVRTVERK